MAAFARCALLLALVSAVASGQVVVRNHATGAIVTSPFLLPDVGVGNSESVALDIVNTGAASVTVQSAATSGLYYSLCCETGFVLPAGAAQTLTLSFAPTQTGYFSGALQIDDLAIFLFGRSIAAPLLFVQTAAGLQQANTGTPLVLTEPTSFSGQFSCVLQNASAGPETVQSLAASGDWSVINGPALPLVLAAGQQATFTLATGNASSTGTLAGVVTIGSFAYAIDAHPPMPGIHIQVPTTPLASGQQAALAINFDSPPAEALAGTLTLSLTTANAVELTDPAILFPSSGSTTASFTSVIGQTVAQFGTQTSLTFQTGTTAGTLHIHAEWGYSEADAEIPLVSAPITIESVAATKGSGTLNLTITGFDNTRTAGRMSFSFFDAQGAYIGQPVTADFTELFYNFFQSQFNAGGMFKMTAQFPVTGGTGGIASVQVDLMNTAGDAQSAKTGFH